MTILEELTESGKTLECSYLFHDLSRFSSSRNDYLTWTAKSIRELELKPNPCLPRAINSLFVASSQEFPPVGKLPDVLTWLAASPASSPPVNKLPDVLTHLSCLFPGFSAFQQAAWCADMAYSLSCDCLFSGVSAYQQAAWCADMACSLSCLISEVSACRFDAIYRFGIFPPSLAWSLQLNPRVL